MSGLCVLQATRKVALNDPAKEIVLGQGVTGNPNDSRLGFDNFSYLYCIAHLLFDLVKTGLAKLR